MYRAILIAASWLVPVDQRAAWHAEWIGELCHAERMETPGFALRFCLGSFKDALWLRRNNPRTGLLQFKSPGRCLAFLAAMACASLSMSLMTEPGRQLLGFSHMTGICYGFDCMRVAEARRSVFILPLMTIACACIVLPATTGVSLGDTDTGPGGYRRWLFLASKVALVLLAMAGVSLYAVQTHSPLLLNMTVWVVGFGGISAFRWVLRDQRARCPVCLRLLDKPIELGQASRCLIEWERTELVCLRGHGFLHVPGVTTTWRGTQEWHRLDASWSHLFSGN